MVFISYLYYTKKNKIFFLIVNVNVMNMNMNMEIKLLLYGVFDNEIIYLYTYIADNTRKTEIEKAPQVR